MLHRRRGLLRRRACWKRDIFPNDGPISVEHMCGLDLLRERFVLHEGFSGKTFFLGHVFGTIIVALHVGDSATERSLFANVTLLRRISQHIFRWNHHLVVVFRIAIVLVYLIKLFHMLVGCIRWLSNMLCRSEWFLISVGNLSLTIFFSDHLKGSFFEWITNTVMGRLAE